MLKASVMGFSIIPTTQKIDCGQMLFEVLIWTFLYQDRFAYDPFLDPNNLPPVLEDPLLKKALDILHIMNFSKEEQDAYEGRLKWLRMEVNALQKYEKKWW